MRLDRHHRISTFAATSRSATGTDQRADFELVALETSNVNRRFVEWIDGDETTWHVNRHIGSAVKRQRWLPTELFRVPQPPFCRPSVPQLVPHRKKHHEPLELAVLLGTLTENQNAYQAMLPVVNQVAYDVQIPQVRPCISIK